MKNNSSEIVLVLVCLSEWFYDAQSLHQNKQLPRGK
jgi:hypothetical protein